MSSQGGGRRDHWFEVDLRSLAMFRIALAGVLLYDLIDRARDLGAHYTDAGILPADLLEQLAGSGIRFSLHYHLGSSFWAIVGLFVLSWLAATALLFGHRTRVATFICWLLLASLQLRNPYLASMGGDALLWVLLTWGLLLPLGARYSLDALRDPTRGEAPNRLRSIPAAGLLLQVCVVYWVTGLVQDGATWQGGSAVYYALALDYWVTPIGAALRERAWLLPFLTHATRWFELLGPFLAFAPIWTAQLRLLAILLFAGFHLSLALCLDIGMFPLVSMVGWLAFIPTWFWNRLLPDDSDEWTGVKGEPRGDEEDDPEPEAEAGEGDRHFAPPRPLTPLLAQVGGLALLLYILASLASQLGWLGVRIPEPVSQVASALRMQQSWSMFSPNPPAMDFWPVVSGTMSSGESVDLFRDAPTTFDKPDSIAATLPSLRWRYYFWALVTLDPEDPRFEPTHRALARHLCRVWNEANAGERLIRELRVSIVVEFTRAKHEQEAGIRTLFETACAAPPRLLQPEP